MLKPLTLDDRGLIKDYFVRFPPIFSECTFSNLFMWGQDRPTSFCEIEGTLLFFIEDHVLFGPPVGPLPIEEVVRRLPFDVGKAVRTTLPTDREALDWTFNTCPEHADYVYLVSDLADLRGSRFQKKRQLVRGCLNRYRCSYEPIEEGNLQECLTLYREAEERHPTERHAVERLFQHYHLFDVFGGAIRIDGRIEGFMIAKALNPSTAVGHAEWTNHNFHGLAELMHHWMAKYSLNDFVYFNLEQDLGIPGLREAKRRFRPDRMIIKWNGWKNY